MSDGLSAANVAATLAEIVSGASFVQLHTGNPGAAGTANASSVTTRQAVAWGSVSGGTITASSTPAFANWAGTNGESVSDLSFWSLATGGTFQFSVQLTSGGTPSPVTMNTTDNLNLTPLSVTLPVAS